MIVSKVVVLEDQAIQFNGELSAEETDLVVGVGLNYLIRAGMFPKITEALAAAQKEEEAAQGYSDPSSEFTFPPDMDKND